MMERTMITTTAKHRKDDACSNAAYDAPFVATPTQNARRKPRRAFCATADAASQRSIRGHPRRTTPTHDAGQRCRTTHHSWHANAAARRTTHHSWPALDFSSLAP
ncbi:hypothetical protein L596_030531 [Steinernema carpocapsae]|uniref:Uncharacterized protein n=1 Tax=Steinernema carpocapsae TaxID=34508 RepID=A0A4U5LPM7_STECR|nr:hypothetical protein L596_030531 [Steinernema carpocapsae]